jgi:ADP-ribose pyrophosphatase
MTTPNDRTSGSDWKVLRTERGPEYHIFKTRQDLIENPRNGKVLNAIILEAPEWVDVVAITPAQKIVTVRQFRFGIRKMSLELPAGLVDPGENPLQAAQRELAEETGYTAREWKPIGWSYACPAFLTNRAHHFLARDARKTNTPNPEEGEDLECREMTLEEIRDAIRGEEMRNAMTLVALAKVFDLRDPR